MVSKVQLEAVSYTSLNSTSEYKTIRYFYLLLYCIVICQREWLNKPTLTASYSLFVLKDKLVKIVSLFFIPQMFGASVNLARIPSHTF